VSAAWDAADWLARWKAAGGGYQIVADDQRVWFYWPEDDWQQLNQIWSEIGQDPGRKAEVKALLITPEPVN
jgi:hypothetical protein